MCFSASLFSARISVFLAGLVTLLSPKGNPSFLSGAQSKTVLELEDLLCSKTRIKILKLLLSAGQLNTTEIAKRVDANYEKARGHLDVLEDEGIVQKTLFGSRIRFYKLNEQSAKTQALKTLLKLWSEP